jgi:hypothetical protein
MIKEAEDDAGKDLIKLNEVQNGDNEKRPKRFAAQVAQVIVLVFSFGFFLF